MKQWQTMKLPDCLEKSPKATKVPKKDFKRSGVYPVVSQEKGLVNGYWDDENDVVQVGRPLIVFGDHTQVVKLVDFNFVVGADGVKLLKPKSCLDSKYFYYFLLGNPLKTLGYARHFRLLKELDVVIPPLPEQKRIVAVLDEAFAGIDTAVANTDKNLANARELFESYLNSVFSQQGAGWTSIPLEQNIRFIDYRGKTPTKTEQGLRLITAKNVRMGFLQREPEEFMSMESYDTWMTRGIPQKGDVLFTTEAPLGLVCQLDTEDKVAFAQRIITMQPDRDVVRSGYLAYVLRSPLVQGRIHEKATGATAAGIKASLLKKIHIPQVSTSRQDEILAHLEVVEASVKELESIYQQKLTALAELKQSLLQKAFSGELTADKAAPDAFFKEEEVA